MSTLELHLSCHHMFNFQEFNLFTGHQIFNLLGLEDLRAQFLSNWMQSWNGNEKWLLESMVCSCAISWRLELSRPMVVEVFASSPRKYCGPRCGNTVSPTGSVVFYDDGCDIIETVKVLCRGDQDIQTELLKTVQEHDFLFSCNGYGVHEEEAYSQSTASLTLFMVSL